VDNRFGNSLFESHTFTNFWLIGGRSNDARIAVTAVGVGVRRDRARRLARGLFETTILFVEQNLSERRYATDHGMIVDEIDGEGVGRERLEEYLVV